MHNAREHIREREGEENGTEQVAGFWPPPGNAQDSAADGHKVSGDAIHKHALASSETSRTTKKSDRTGVSVAIFEPIINSASQSKHWF